MLKIGKVHLVGAGPGDPELLTLRAARLIAQASAIVHDRLVADAVLAMSGPNAVLFDVGKCPKRHPVPQQAINELLIELAIEGHEVVRLKGGDPFIFGRGSEEAAALEAAGIPYDVVPGITAAQGAAASLGIALTHRGVAEHVTYMTGHCRADRPLDFDFAKLANEDGTLVVYMGLATIGEIAARLIEHGLSAHTPVLVVNRATTPQERHLTGTISTIAVDICRAELEGPCVFIIGAVAGLSRVLGKIGHERPLFSFAAQ
ncbi:uroporphyrinogen-III C-methyltransferase [Xanthobacter autotrophicus]|uniref:uroporphyrinogen-III C-methyltransferase n=1 Tax=Xanthobacter autotrophicus TaxID=280 RepID=UPI0037278E6D